jgi:6-phosphogluconolactonase/glucosamine-6-phosphate isomerase/deaminase
MIDYVFSSQPSKSAAEAVAREIKKHLLIGERVLWLLSGGSGTAVAIGVSKKLTNLDLSNLFVSLTDERYGDLGHQDENWQHLLDDGFKLDKANLYRLINGQPIEQTVAKFNEWLTSQLARADFKIGIFGLGTDGHTAGIKPRSIATKSDDLAVSYKADDFDRVTISFATILQLNTAIIQASGIEKLPIINSLINNTISYIDQPAQILKFIPNATLYTNNKREET